MSHLKLVQVKMSEDTLNQIEDVKNRLHADTVTGTIKSSIAIADMVTKAMSLGDNVIIQKPNGEKYIMTMPGISNHG
jgi:hypothetical protein